jgi:hypothetical protein
MDLQLPVSITTKLVSLNLAHGEVYSIFYVMKFVSDLRQVGGNPVSSTNETDRYNIILLNVALNSITLMPQT